MLQSGSIALLALTLVAPPGAATPATARPASTSPTASPTPAPPPPRIEPVPEARPAPAGMREGPPLAPSPTPPPGPCYGSKPCKRLIVLSSVTGGLGLATIIAGAVVVSRPLRVGDHDPTMAIDYRPAGSAVLAIGFGVLATGVLMAFAAARASRQARRTGVLARHGLGLAF